MLLTFKKAVTMAEFDLNDIAKHYEEMNDSDIIRIATQAAKGLRPEVFIVIENEISKRKLNPDIMKGVIAQSKEYTLEELEFFAEKIRELSCPICNQKKNKLNGTVAFRVKSFVLVTTFEKKHIIACPNCLNKENKKSIKSTLLFGWWGIPWGIIKTPQFVYKNISIKIYDPYLGVITNSPTYDWHLINQRNYLGLTNYPNPSQTFGAYEMKPLGSSSGLLGLPGDFTPPSRFVRAAAFTASCRPLASSTDAVFESFRILDNFNIPLGSQMPKDKLPNDIVSATHITSSSDLKKRVYYYNNMSNRQVRKIDLKKIDFSTIKKQIINDDVSKMDNVKDVTPISGAKNK